jgi:predicted TIM-barrel fold metal-dependent hydrolase
MMSVSQTEMERQGVQAVDPVLVISSDGHALANMEDYRQYLPSRMHEEFDQFFKLYKIQGARSSDAAALLQRADADTVDQWTEQVLTTGRVAGASDPHIRLREMDADGRAADVLFPDFGLAFELGTIIREGMLGYSRTPEQTSEGYRAHNRWLADYISVAPHRFAAMACIDFSDVEAAVEEIRWAHHAGMKGVLLPAFDDEFPVFHPRFEPIWNTVEDLGLPLNGHVGNTSITQRPPMLGMLEAIPHPACAIPLCVPQNMFFTHQILNHMIWGGVLEKHPDMKLLFTEQGSGWVVGELESMDYTYEGSYLRRDIREIVPRKPSEYFARQCFLGSSIFSRAEVESRHKIGLDKMMLGMDYPHHEGTWAVGPGTREYLRATLGVARVPADEAKKLLGETAAPVFGFDLDALEPIARDIGPSLKEILTPPTTDWYPRGDVNKPAATSMAG